MRNYFDQQFSFAAGQSDAASCNMSADAYTEAFLTAIIALMAVVFIISVFAYLAEDVLISIIFGIVILIVRGKIKPVSRTR